jgi:hypothetical protein
MTINERKSADAQESGSGANRDDQRSAETRTAEPRTRDGLDGSAEQHPGTSQSRNEGSGRVGSISSSEARR